MDLLTCRGDEAEPTEVVTFTTLEPLAERIRRMGEGGRRVMIGLSGAPGAGKSTLAADLVVALAPDPAVVVPLDGVHLAAGLLAGTELADRRGAIDTFDGGGFRSLVTRLRADRSTVYAPRYAREIEDPIAMIESGRRSADLVVNVERVGGSQTVIDGG